MTKVATPLERYERHVRRYGCEAVLEAAWDELSRDDLARLVRAMRKQDPKWRPPERRRDMLARALLEAGTRDVVVMSILDVSRATLARVRDMRFTTPEGGMDSGQSVSDSDGEGRTLDPPDLTRGGRMMLVSNAGGPATLTRPGPGTGTGGSNA